MKKSTLPQNKKSELIPYELHADSGDTYVVQVTKSVAAALDVGEYIFPPVAV